MAEKFTVSIDERLAREIRRRALRWGIIPSRLRAKTWFEPLPGKRRLKRKAGRALLSIRFSEEEAKRALQELTLMRKGDRY